MLGTGISWLLPRGPLLLAASRKRTCSGAQPVVAPSQPPSHPLTTPCSPGHTGHRVQSHAVHRGGQLCPPATHRGGHADLQAEEVPVGHGPRWARGARGPQVHVAPCPSRPAASWPWGSGDSPQGQPRQAAAGSRAGPRPGSDRGTPPATSGAWMRVASSLLAHVLTCPAMTVRRAPVVGPGPQQRPTHAPTAGPGRGRVLTVPRAGRASGARAGSRGQGA